MMYTTNLCRILFANLNLNQNKIKNLYLSVIDSKGQFIDLPHLAL